MLKKTSYWILAAAALTSVIGLAVVEGTNIQVFKGGTNDPLTLTLDGSNGLGTDKTNLENRTVTISDYTTIKLTNAKSMQTESGWFCRLGAGGTLEKSELSKGMKTFTLNFGIDSNYPTSYLEAYLYNDKDQGVYQKFSIVSGQSYDAEDANYFRVVASNIINIRSVVVTYDCVNENSSALSGGSYSSSFEPHLKKGTAYIAGSTPVADDFECRFQYTKGETTYVRYVSGNSLNVAPNANFATAGGDIALTAPNLDASLSSTFNYTLRESLEANYTSDNSTNLIKECEDMTIVGASALVQTGANYATEYTESNCSYGALHAASYLGYTNELACKGSGTYGGFVHNFDVDNNATMSWTINSDKARQAEFYVRGSTNIVDRTAYKSTDLAVAGQAATFTFRDSDITGALDSSKVFPGRTSSASDENNRTGTVGASTLDGRFLFLDWTDLLLGKIDLQAGDNVLTITAHNASSSGHWDECYLRY